MVLGGYRRIQGVTGGSNEVQRVTMGYRGLQWVGGDCTGLNGVMVWYGIVW